MFLVREGEARRHDSSRSRHDRKRVPSWNLLECFSLRALGKSRWNQGAECLNVRLVSTTDRTGNKQHAKGFNETNPTECEACIKGLHSDSQSLRKQPSPLESFHCHHRLIPLAMQTFKTLLVVVLASLAVARPGPSPQTVLPCIEPVVDGDICARIIEGIHIPIACCGEGLACIVARDPLSLDLIGTCRPRI
ncbi:hypothetical protein SCHPADRAFT_364886 [Schizopora paradoxa]|uniref:Hydrophobin n=1 Tax=Schizopora paradoxa TaxID=27342 RepID=A0A0H2RV75_9AGAM|nr:hypothetical protein SCHPADRAFT_364886 [Schizopora paradoxa]